MLPRPQDGRAAQGPSPSAAGGKGAQPASGFLGVFALWAGAAGWAMQQLLQRGAELGLAPTEVEEALTLGRPTQELAWVQGSDLRGQAQALARDLFEKERVVEYDCCDSQGNPQGRGTIALKEWEDADAALFVGTHGPASDGYYQWYVDHEMGRENGLYHICDCEVSKCKARKGRADRRELIHLGKWRLLTPRAMLDIGYLHDLGVRLGESIVANLAREKKAPRAPLGTGLEEALGKEAEPKRGASRPKDKEMRKRSRSPKRGKESMPQFLLQQAAKQGEKKSAPSKKRKKRGSEKKPKRDEEDSPDKTSSEESESSSFQLAPARGGRVVEACPKETRAPQPNRPRRDEPLSRRQGGDGGGSEELARSKGHGIPEPSYHDGSRSSESGAADDSGTSDAVDGAGSFDGGASGSCQRHLDTTAEGMRDIPVGRGMVDRKALGDHPTDHGHAGAAGREGARHQTRAAGPEDEGGPQEGRSLQIGTRQRTRPKPGKVRESQSSKGRHRSEIESSSTDRGPTYRSKGHLQRSRHSSSQGRSGREEGGQPRPKAKGIKRGPAGRNSGGSPVTKRSKGSVLEEDQSQSAAGRPEGGAPSSAARGVKLRSRSPAGGDEVTSGKVKEIMAWLTENEGEHLSAAQMSQYLLLQAVQLNGPFGRLIETSLKPTWEQSHRVRNLMPLPLWPDVILAMEEAIENQKYKDKPGEWRSRGNTKNKASRALRNQGLLLWHGLTAVGLNWMHSGGSLSEGVGPPAGRATSQQEDALCRIWDMVKTFVEEKPKRGGVPRTPQGGWDAELEKLKVSYTEEVVEKARPLTLEQILPGLPSAEHGGLVNILDVVDEKMKDKLSRPE